jgi:hypothetical protein
MHVDVWETIYSFSMIAERAIISTLSKTLHETFRSHFEQNLLSELFADCLRVKYPQQCNTILDLTDDSPHPKCYRCNIPFINDSYYIQVPCARRFPGSFCSPWCASNMVLEYGRDLYDSLRPQLGLDRMRRFFSCVECGSSKASLCSSDSCVFFMCDYCRSLRWGNDEPEEIFIAEIHVFF